MIIIDAGHGGVWPNGDPGAVSGSKIESHFTFVYANALSSYLEDRGVDTRLTRTQDDHKIPYSNRTKGATADDKFISIHFDSFGGQSSIYYAAEKTPEDSKVFASQIDAQLHTTGGVVPSTDSRFGRLYIDDVRVCPAILIEVAPINLADESPGAIETFCKAVYSGLKQEKKFNTPFQRVFIVQKDGSSKELTVNRMSIVGDKLYIAPEWE